jgi:hypothetical protein
MLPPAPGTGEHPANSSGRDSRGRFAHGNPGRPSRKQLKAGRPGHRNATPSPPGCNGPITEDAAVPEAPPPSGRDARGRFAKNNPGGPGNPFGRRLAALRQALLAAASDEDIRAIATRLLREAQTGDPLSVRLLFLYTLGRPAAVVDPDTLDLQEWQAYQQGLVRPEELTALMQRLPPELVVGLVRILLPCLGRAFRRQLLQQLGASSGGEGQAGPAAEAAQAGG